MDAVEGALLNPGGWRPNGRDTLGGAHRLPIGRFAVPPKEGQHGARRRRKPTLASRGCAPATRRRVPTPRFMQATPCPASVKPGCSLRYHGESVLLRTGACDQRDMFPWRSVMHAVPMEELTSKARFLQPPRSDCLAGTRGLRDLMARRLRRARGLAKPGRVRAQMHPAASAGLLASLQVSLARARNQCGSL